MKRSRYSSRRFFAFFWTECRFCLYEFRWVRMWKRRRVSMPAVVDVACQKCAKVKFHAAGDLDRTARDRMLDEIEAGLRGESPIASGLSAFARRAYPDSAVDEREG